MAYQVLLGEQPQNFLASADEKADRIVRDNLGELTKDPHPRPGAGRGDREKLTVDGRETYRMHIERTYTAFYTIDDDAGEVRVREILPIDDAHKRYG